MYLLDYRFIILLFCHQVVNVQGLVFGAPIENCRSMLPQHDYFLPEMEPIPFTFAAARIHNNNNFSVAFNVSLSSTNRKAFKGYLIQARTNDRQEVIIGTFELEKGDKLSKIINCSGGSENAVTHTFNTWKRFVNFIWKPPADFKGEFYFIATIVAEYKQFWLGIKTPTFHI